MLSINKWGVGAVYVLMQQLIDMWDVCRTHDLCTGISCFFVSLGNGGVKVTPPPLC